MEEQPVGVDDLGPWLKCVIAAGAGHGLHIGTAEKGRKIVDGVKLLDVKPKYHIE